LTPGNIHDCSQAPALIEKAEAGAIIGDKGYDSDQVVMLIESRGTLAVIPSKSNRRVAREHDKELYRERNHVERFFNRIKQYRGLATRYEKTAASYLAMLHLACSRLWLPSCA
jgi:putative transposase